MLFSPAAQDLVCCLGHKDKSFVSSSSDTVYECHPPFKAEGPLQELRSWEGDRVTSALGMLGDSRQETAAVG